MEPLNNSLSTQSKRIFYGNKAIKGNIIVGIVFGIYITSLAFSILTIFI